MIKILQGSCLDKLKELPDQSINTCITSPPYWGLRDYGTAEWEGGDPNCDHINANKIGGQGIKSKKQHTSIGTQNFQHQKACSKCGAVRKDKQLGMEDTPEEFVDNLVEVFREVKRVLRDDGTVWLNLGDSFLSNKQLGCIPFKVAIALQQDNWILRQDIIWHKPNPMPESVRDRCTKAHEYIFLLSKSPKYYFDNEAIKEDSTESSKARLKQNIANQKGSDRVPGKNNGNMKAVGGDKRNKRSVWTVTTKPFKGAHFATFPMDLIEPCVLAGCPEKVCVACGTPYERVIQKQKSLQVERNKRSGTNDRKIGGVLDKYNRENPPIDLGLEKQCNCETNETKPGTVLDPFGGSGTTGIVASNHNRNAVLIELNAEYIEIARQRIQDQGGLFTDLEIVNGDSRVLNGDSRV
jgi:DNA modification methylase